MYGDDPDVVKGGGAGLEGYRRTMLMPPMKGVSSNMGRG